MMSNCETIQVMQNDLHIASVARHKQQVTPSWRGSTSVIPVERQSHGPPIVPLCSKWYLLKATLAAVLVLLANLSVKHANIHDVQVRLALLGIRSVWKYQRTTTMMRTEGGSVRHVEL